MLLERSGMELHEVTHVRRCFAGELAHGDSTDFVFAKIQRSERRQSAPGRIARVEALRSEHGSLVGSIEYAGAHPLGQ